MLFKFVELSSSSNACDPNLCQNGGTCEDIGNGDYRCECPGDYGGDNCEKGKTSKVFVFGCLPVLFIKSITSVGKVWCFCSQEHTKSILHIYLYIVILFLDVCSS